MFGRFLRRETSFFDFFEQHAALTIEGTKEFLSLVTTGANIPAKCRRISDIEHETDTITHRCVEALHKTFITRHRCLRCLFLPVALSRRKRTGEDHG